MRFVCLFAVALAVPAPLFAEIQLGTSSHVSVPSRPILRNSGLIFSGTAIKVEHLRQEGSPGITQITFRVENAIRGVRRGQVIKIREWEGLWNTGERYQVGERVLLMLYPASRLGLTSPMGGPLGRYQIDKSGRVLVRGPGGRPKPVSMHDFAAAVGLAAGE